MSENDQKKSTLIGSLSTVEICVLLAIQDEVGSLDNQANVSIKKIANVTLVNNTDKSMAMLKEAIDSLKSKGLLSKISFIE